MLVYLDLDGVMADFDGAFEARFGSKPTEITDKELWESINSFPKFFRTLPPCRGAIDFFRMLDRMHNVRILTACPASNYEEVAFQKRDWVREHLSKDVEILPCRGGKTKHFFMNHPGDVLIDDHISNCERWHIAGGFPIHHVGDFDLTSMLLREATHALAQPV